MKTIHDELEELGAIMDATTEEEAKTVFLGLAQTVGGRLRQEGQKAGMISVEIKYHTFRRVSHQKQMEKATNSDQLIYESACQLFRELWNGEPIRLLGIRTSKLMDDEEPEQMDIFELQQWMNQDVSRKEKHKKLDVALDTIRRKFGEDAITRGTFLKEKEK